MVEVLFVIAIIVLLSSVVIVNLAESKQRSRDVQRKSDIETLQVAFRLYADANSGYPITGHELGTIIDSGVIDAELLNYVSGHMQDPLYNSSSETYGYVYDSDHDCGTDNYIVLVVQTMERSGLGNYTSVCDATLKDFGNGRVPSENSYIVLLRKNAP